VTTPATNGQSARRGPGPSPLLRHLAAQLARQHDDGGGVREANAEPNDEAQEPSR